MQLRIVPHNAHFNQPANKQRVYPSKITYDKTSAMRNVHVLCSNCARSFFHHSPTALSTHWSSLSQGPQCIVDVLDFGLIHPFSKRAQIL